jgi:hypothetical protein
MSIIPSKKTRLEWYIILLSLVKDGRNKAIQDLLQQYLEKCGVDNFYEGVDYWDLIPEIYEQKTTQDMVYWFKNDTERGRALVTAIIKMTATPQQELEWLELILPVLEEVLAEEGYCSTCVRLRDNDQTFRRLLKYSYSCFSLWPCELLLPHLYLNRDVDELSWFESQANRVNAVKKTIEELKLKLG